MSFTVAEALELNERGDKSTALGMLQVFVGLPGLVPRARASIWCAMGTIYEELGWGAEAHFAYRTAASIDPTDVSALNNLGSSALGWSRWQEGQTYLQSALHYDPNHACALNGMGTVWVQRGDHQKALGYFERTLALEPLNAQAHWNRSLSLLATDQWAEGWREHEWRKRFKRVNPRTAPISDQPEWDGGSLAGTRLLVHCEQGWGDMLMWARLGPMLKERGATIIWEAHLPLVPLFKLQSWADVVFEAGKPMPEHDLHVFLLTAARLLGMEPSTDPTMFPYLRTHKATRLGNEARRATVGLVWRGRIEHGTNELRSAPSAFADELVKAVPNVNWVSMQKDYAPPVGSVDGRPYMQDFAQSAAVLRACDLLVTIDSAPLHLAGALNVPCIALLHHNAEWRWRPDLHRGMSRWYRSVEFLQQREPSDWLGLIPELQARLN